MVTSHFDHYRCPSVTPAEGCFGRGKLCDSQGSSSFSHSVPKKKKNSRGGEGSANTFASSCASHYWTGVGIHVAHLVEMQIFQEPSALVMWQNGTFPSLEKSQPF